MGPENVDVMVFHSPEGLEDWLLALNESGEHPTAAGMDSSGQAFLGNLYEFGGDEVYAEVLLDSPTDTTMGRQPECNDCGAWQGKYRLDHLEYPVAVLRHSKIVGAVTS